MAGSGILKVVEIARVAVMVPAHMYGTMRRPSRIYFRHWNAAFVIPNFVKARMKEAIRISGPPFQYNRLHINFMQRQMDNWAAL